MMRANNMMQAFIAAGVLVANASAGEMPFPADVTNVCTASVSGSIDRKLFDKGANLLGDAPLRMQNIAHRGMWDKHIPQNTMEAIRRAYESGATWVETDFHHTKAGQMVCIHAERELKDYTGCAKKIVDLSPEDVATLNLGTRDGLSRESRMTGRSTSGSGLQRPRAHGWADEVGGVELAK